MAPGEGVSRLTERLAFAPVSELLRRPALELAALVRAGELSARELVEESLSEIERLGPELNAFAHVAADAALAAADAIAPGDPRPFAGVPIAIKDNRAVAGMPITMGSDLFTGIVPPHDSFCVRRLKDAGFIVVGTTTMPEMGILPTTESRRYGPTRNPWALDRTPGGSSGGSAAAVAAGIVPIAHGNDGGGSIRIPASCCGLVGLKAARGRVSVGPEQGQSFLVSDGVLTRSVADTVAALDVLAGYEPGDAAWAPPPPAPYAELAARDPGRLRVALALAPPLADVTLDPNYEAAARDTAGVLAELGHEVEELEPPWAGLDLLDDFTGTFGPMVSLTVLIGGQLAGREPTEDDVEPLTWAMWQLARERDSVALLGSMGRLEVVSRTFIAGLSAYDAVITPALATPPVRIGEINGLGADPMTGYERSVPFTPYAALFNVTGQPAISLPVHTADGLPVAVQLAGRPAQEEVLLQLALQLEQARPWADRVPPTA
jgi:amidase